MRLRSQLFIVIISSLLLFLFSGCGTSSPTSTGGGTGGSVATIPTPPVASATAGNTQNTITWPVVTGATSYNIYWTNNPAASATVRASGTKIPAVTSPYNHIGLTNSSTYYYVITTVNSVGESNPSNTVAATPLASLPLATPASLSAIAISTTSAAQINLNWTAAGGATSYNIYSSIAPNPAITPANLVAATASTSFSHTALTTNTTYYYKVTAIINASESNPSNTASATTPPLIPTGLVATASGTRQINLSWSPTVGATSYNIYYSTTSNLVTKTNGTLIPNVVGTSYNHAGLTPGTTYYYSIATVGSPNTNLSDNSATVSATTAQIGVNWQNQSSGVIGQLNAITYSGNQFVAVGSIVGTNPIIISSPDGITWTPRTNGAAYNLMDITWSGSQFVAVGHIGTILTSPDAITWTPKMTGRTFALWGVAYGNGKYVITEDGGHALISTDGNTWTLANGLLNSNGLTYTFALRNTGYSICWSGSQFVIVSGVGGYSLPLPAMGCDMYTSVDGNIWYNNANTLFATPPINSQLWGITYGNGKYVAVGFGGMILTSYNGTNWIVQTSGTINNLWNIAWSGTQFIAVGDSGTILTSPDGVAWTSRTSGTLNNLFGVTVGNNKIIVVGNSTILISQ